MMFGPKSKIDPKQYISDKGIFDARAGRVELSNAVRNNRLLMQVFNSAEMNGLSEVDRLLLSVLSLTIAYEDLMENMLRDLNSRPMPPFVVGRVDKP